jgi:alkanesulfonate monooxygenase SsuD/methylene tetrahydromethanopterin reductase-like flavin-dependent oxidoreductase (luciferase family)
LRYTLAIPGLTMFPGLGGQPDWANDLTPDHIRIIAERAEALGFSQLVIPWHMAMPPDEFAVNMGARWPHSIAAAGMLLGATRTIQVAPLVVAPCHQPIELAKALVTLDWMSGGRCLPVILSGYVQWEFDLLGADYENRDAVTDDYVEAMLRLWGDAKPSYDGQFVKVPELVFEPKPRRGRIPLWFGGRTKRALRRMAKYGDGWMSYATAASDIPAAVDYIRAQPGAETRPLDIFCYFVDPTHDPVSHKETVSPEFPVGDAAIIERARFLGDCKINVTTTPLNSYAERGKLAPSRSFEEYLARLDWFGQEIIPATRAFGETPSAANAPVQQNA